MHTHQLQTPHDVPAPIAAATVADPNAEFLRAEAHRLAVSRAWTRFHIIFLTTLIVAIAVTATVLIVKLS